MKAPRVVIVGGGAAGFFAAIHCAETNRDARVVLLEKGPHFLSKVRISGGGRCNVTHACFEPRELIEFYPRGGAELLGPFHDFQPSDTVQWFEQRGVPLKTEPDGRMFPVTDSSATIVECLVRAAQQAGVELLANRAVAHAERLAPRQPFRLCLSNGERLECDRLMLATGGCRSEIAGQLAVSLGHRIQSPVPSLFTFQLAPSVWRDLAGISVPDVDVSVPEMALRARGPVLLTHAGLSGPAILRLSAWGARALHQAGYQFPLQLNWLPALDESELQAEFEARRGSQPARQIVNSPIGSLPARLWETLVLASGLPRATRWAALSRSARHQLLRQLRASPLPVVGKSLNKDEFVTCGGVCLAEVTFKTMESRICPGLFFGGELLDIDGLTGGFNFQAAWTTGWIAGQAMAAPLQADPAG